MIIVDTREKKWSHIQKYFDTHGIEYTIRKNDVADYVRDDIQNVAVDRKQHLGEVLMNLCSRDSSRFWRELRLAHQRHMKIVFLVEINRVKVDGQWRDVKCIADVAKSGWQSQYSRVSCRELADKMFKATMAYGVEWRFTNKRSSGKEIVKILWQEKSH